VKPASSLFGGQEAKNTPLFGASEMKPGPAPWFGAASPKKEQNKKSTIGKTKGVVFRGSNCGKETSEAQINEWAAMLDDEVKAVSAEILRVQQWDSVILDCFVKVDHVRKQCQALSTGKARLLEILLEIERGQNELSETIADLQRKTSNSGEDRIFQQQHRDALERARSLNERISDMTQVADRLQQDIRRASCMEERNVAALILQNRTTLQTTSDMLKDLENAVNSLPK